MGRKPNRFFVVMLPFELIKSLLIKAVQRRTWKSAARKVMFVDVSKAHLYAPVGEETKAYVDLPP